MKGRFQMLEDETLNLKPGFLAPNGLGSFVLLGVFIVLIVLMCSLLPSGAGAADELTVTPAHIEQYIYDFLGPAQDKRRAKAPEYASMIHEISVREGIDPLLSAVTVGAESSFWARAVGRTHGETGLMQVHSPEARRGHDLTTARGQLEAGISYLAGRYEVCGEGNHVKAVGAYISGRCNGVPGKAKYRVRKWRKARARLLGQ